MSKSIIIYNVPGGKTRFAQRIADHFNIATFHQGDPFTIRQIDELGFIENDSFLHMWRDAHFEVRSFQSVADEINASISLTDWQSGPPPMVGEWNASFGINFANRRRWWDGERWSHVWIDGVTSQELSNKSAAIRIEDAEGMVWRGLSQEPIKVTE